MTWKRELLTTIDQQRLNSTKSTEPIMMMHIPVTSKPLPAFLSRRQSVTRPSDSVCAKSLSSLSSTDNQVMNDSCDRFILSVHHTQHNLYSLETGIKSHDHDQQQIPPSYDMQTQEIQGLRQGLFKLNEKYLKQIEHTVIAEQARTAVEQELEELSCKLFEEANKMVSKERRALFDAQKRIEQLEQTLERVHEELNHEHAQLEELRKKFQEQLIENSTTTKKLHHRRFDNEATEQQQQQHHHHLLSVNTTYSDPNSLLLFKEFITLAPKTSLDQIHQITFLMQCLDQDVEPCLRLSSLRHTGRLPMRKTLQSIIHHPCCIEPVDFKEKNEQLVPIAAAPSPKRSSWDSQTSLESEGILVCYGCGSEIKYHENQSLFRYRLDEINDEYCWIDQACRDRLVAVCNFYSFVRHIRSGLRNQSSIQELFDECIQLRLIMFYARAGVHYPDH